MNQDIPSQNNANQADWEPRDLNRAIDAECDRVLALIPAYSIGATDRDEDEFIKATLAQCPEATAELAKYRRLAEALHYGASPVPPPPALAHKLRASINISTSVHTAAPPALPGAPKHFGPGFEQALARRYWRLGLALFTGLLLLLLVSNIYWLTQVEQLRSYEAQFAARLHDQDTALMLIGLGASNRIDLPAMQADGQETPFAAIIWDPGGEYALLYVKDFPVLPPDKAYQLWLDRDGQQTSPGMFSVDRDGFAIFVFHTSVPIHSFSGIEITAEVAEGNSKPTSAPIVRRTL